MQEELAKLQAEGSVTIEESVEGEVRICRIKSGGKVFEFKPMPKSWEPYDLIAYVIRTYANIEKSADFDDWVKRNGISPNMEGVLSSYNLLKSQGKRLKEVIGSDIFFRLNFAYWSQYYLN